MNFSTKTYFFAGCIQFKEFCAIAVKFVRKPVFSHSCTNENHHRHERFSRLKSGKHRYLPENIVREKELILVISTTKP